MLASKTTTVFFFFCLTERIRGGAGDDCWCWLLLEALLPLLPLPLLLLLGTALITPKGRLDSASDVTKPRRECRTSEPNEIRVSIVSDDRTLTFKTFNNIFRMRVTNCDMGPSLAGITGRN